MNLFLRCLALSPLLVLVAACCANNPSNCNDLQADSLYLTLNRTSPDSTNVSFTKAEVDTVYIQRYNPATTPIVLSDAMALVRAQPRPAINALLKSANLDVNTIVISNTFPFTPSTTGGKLNAYNYRLTVKDGSKGAQAYTFDITNIQLTGNYEADGCSTCYHNTGKSFQVNGQPAVNVTETGGVPVPVVLSKK